MARQVPASVVTADPQGALQEWSQLLGEAAVVTGQEALARYARSSSPGHGEGPLAVLLPRDTAQVMALVEIAGRFGLPLYPISRGKNWGYGDARPSGPGQVIVDLRHMNRILEVNRQLGYAVVEPGVTQGQLHAYLEANDCGWVADATGAGPHASIVGNTVDRGFGHTRYGDHFLNSCGLEVVLANGQLLKTGFGHYANSKVTHVYKYGVGPVLDGLFSQSNLGIVTRVGVWLLPKPEAFNAFFFFADAPEDLMRLVDELGALRRQGVLHSCIHVGNDFRILSSRTQYPWERTQGVTPLPDEVRAGLRQQFRVAAWTGAGTLAGPPEVVRAARTCLRRALKGFKVLFLDDRRLAMADRLGRMLAAVGLTTLRDQVNVARPIYDYLRGVPNTDAMRGVLWRVRQRWTGEVNDPLETPAGFQWVSPIVPAIGHDAWQVNVLMERIYRKHGFDPLITFTLVNERSLCCVSNLAFDKTVAEDVRRARACYEELTTALRTEGYPLYRSGPGSFANLSRDSTVFWDVVKTLKHALDPHNLMSPGRYEA